MTYKLACTVVLSVALCACGHDPNGLEVAASKGAIPATLNKIVTEKAEKHSVPTQLAQAVTQTESKWQPGLRGMAGEYGLMQIKCPTARGEGFTGSCRELFDPNVNAEYGVRYLHRALERANGDWCHAATLYNRGVYAKPRRSEYCDTVTTLARQFAPRSSY
jgi:soluble lytic murein transglycosylase-like protein